MRFVWTISWVLIAWELVSRFVLPEIDPMMAILIPAPTVWLSTAGSFILSGQLPYHIFQSLKRVLLAWSITALVAIPLGIAMAWWHWLNKHLEPAIELIRPIPPIAWIPLSILWFGIGDFQNEFIIAIGAFFPILLNTIHGVTELDGIYIKAGQSLGANQWRIFRKIIIWGALPSIFTGLRIGLGAAWMCLVAAELVGATSGLGFMIQDARNFLRTDIVVLGMIVIGVLGILLDRGLIYLRNAIMPWHMRFS